VRRLAICGLCWLWAIPALCQVVQFPGVALTFTPFTSTANSLLVYGDSKCSLMGFQSTLQKNLMVGSAIRPVDSICRSGYDVAMMKPLVDADIAAYGAGVPAVAYLLFNLGVNDVSHGLPAQATWEANTGYILDAFHTKWAGIHVYLMLVWDRQGPQGDLDTVNTWIGNVVAARAGWAFAGPNEQVWLEGGDDGATMTYDGVHYSAAGNTTAAAQWKTALGL
jgi:hypothetical protein